MKDDAVIFDRDGTLASVAYCAPTDNGASSWRNYNSSLRFDAPIPVVAALLRSIRPGIVRIMTSGRMEGDWPGDRSRRFAMQDWIVKHHLPIDELHMRAGGDTRKDSIVKTEMFETLISPFYNVLYVVDDRPQVVQAWRELGLKVLQVQDPDIMPPISEMEPTCNCGNPDCNYIRDWC